METRSCSECTHLGLRRMIDSGPYQYFGDIPCTRCKRYIRKNDEFKSKTEWIKGKEWKLKY